VVSPDTLLGTSAGVGATVLIAYVVEHRAYYKKPSLVSTVFGLVTVCALGVGTVLSLLILMTTYMRDGQMPWTKWEVVVCASFVILGVITFTSILGSRFFYPNGSDE
jgi:peptidoglycan biosynthesis protein MviN/MurJ (putative lipid II flippase)